MKINLHNISTNQFTSYAKDHVLVNNAKYDYNIVVNNIDITPFNIINIKDIRIENLDTIIQTKPDLIIFGTSNTIIYPTPEIMQYLHNKRIGVEVMSISALCRTFNFLIGEGRNVTSIIIF